MAMIFVVALGLFCPRFAAAQGAEDLEIVYVPGERSSESFRPVRRSGPLEIGGPILNIPFQVTEDLSLLEVLGEPVQRATVIYFDAERFADAEQAADLLRSVLSSVIVSPERNYGRPRNFPNWAEYAVVHLEAELHYAGGATGRLQTNGHHLRFDDPAGLSWFHRWDQLNPRREKVESSSAGD